MSPVTAAAVTTTATTIATAGVAGCAVAALVATGLAAGPEVAQLAGELSIESVVEADRNGTLDGYCRRCCGSGRAGTGTLDGGI